ncbi:MAG: NAD(P)H-dependent oxidoreductase subunit E [Aquabacterium sp.]|uniref:NAD(P)H-dependent oxidoreductase subunit E n=1 Tax=Aquabacterium sp. TaxID=1872578 RepID=UPI0025C55466|nr:NAD(P)H-dependent oxidoreductase subunit E [Aquabacterium sp.]MBI3384302.1 NAD(P)H-dependent oxidoreductase subunit E [Aquabacterium sp.]
MPLKTEISDIKDILQRYQAGPADLLQVLRQVQAHFHHVPAFAIEALVQAWGLSYAAVRSVVGFYHFLSFEPRGRYTLYLSDSVTDRMLGSEAITRRLAERLGVTLEQVRGDGLVSLHRTSCTGLCDQGPAGLVNGHPLTRLTARRADEVADLILSDTPLDAWPADFFEVSNPVWRHNLTLRHPIAPGQAITRMLAMGPQAMLDELQASGLRGRGGAGFATWQKWQACRQATGLRAITCNADEGEPGTFKDRMLLMQWAHELIEGMTLAALTVGATQGFLYVRGEYEFIEPHLREVLQVRRDRSLLGNSISGSGQAFDVALHLGAGAYVCGEETALIESVEGKRGIPRTRPPFPVDRGYLGLPTVNNNVETFVQVAQIAVHGGAWFAAQGTAASRGTRILSVAGDVARPGLYEVPWGVTVAEVLADSGATDVQAVLVGGPSGKLIDASQLQRQISFEDLPTGGAFTVFNRSRDMVDVATQYTRFFAHESCGFCTPCRVGCGQLLETAERLITGHASPWDITRLKETASLMQHHSHCGLGQTAAHPLLDVIQHFPDQVERRLVPDEQAFDLDAATADMHANTPTPAGRPA